VLTNRWAVLLLLFLVRGGMGMQYQLPAALSPLFIGEFALSLADVGLLIGLYHAPGALLAFPGGAIAARLGDKRVVLAALVLMMLAELIVAASSLWPIQIAARFAAGAGGIFLNVVMTKMLADWFAEEDTATAMAIFGNAALFGMGLALLVLPHVATIAGRPTASIIVALYLAAAFVALLILYRAPARNPAIAAAPIPSWPDSRTMSGVLGAGVAYGLYNVALVIAFAFAPLMLADRGWTLTAAASTTSLVLWVAAVSLPAGGILADRTGRHAWVLFGGLATFAIAMGAASRVEAVFAAFLLLGMTCGLPCGPLMSVGPRMLKPETRAIGMGALFTVYYALQVAGPWVVGRVAEIAGGPQTALDLGALLLCASAAVCFASRRLVRST
jgi:MFS family permease